MDNVTNHGFRNKCVLFFSSQEAMCLEAGLDFLIFFVSGDAAGRLFW